MESVTQTPLQQNHKQPLQQQQQQQQQQQHKQQPQQQQMLPIILSPKHQTLSLSSSNDNYEQNQIHHEQIIEQVISLENEFSETVGILGNASNTNSGNNTSQLALENLNDIGLPANNQFSSSSDDLFNLLMEFDRDSSNLLNTNFNLARSQSPELDDRIRIESIREQLLSCDSQPDSQQTASLRASPICTTNSSIVSNINQIDCRDQNPIRVQNIDQSSYQSRQQSQVIQPSSLSMRQAPPQKQAQTTSITNQSALRGNFTDVSITNAHPRTFLSQSHQQVQRVPQSNSMAICDTVSNPPAWQSNLHASYVPQSPPDMMTQSMSKIHHTIQPQQMIQTPATPTQLQINRNQMQLASPNQSLTPPETMEPSPVVRKNPLLNAQLINSRSPSSNQNRFLAPFSGSTSVMNQNPILNAKLSQSPVFNDSSDLANARSIAVSSRTGYIQQPINSNTNFEYDAKQQQNYQQGPVGILSPSDNQTSNTIFRTMTTSPNTGASLNTNTSGDQNLQVKSEIRRKASHQPTTTTSVLKQLLSD